MNVEVISLEEDLDRFQKVEIVPNRRSLGAKCRQDLPAVLQGLASFSQFVTLDDSVTQIDSTNAQQILDTTIYELMGEISTKQVEINNLK